MNRHLFCGILLLGLAGAPALSGCKDSTVGTVHGEVTLDGRPVQEGGIYFSPEAGNTPSGGAVIENGKFTAQVPVGKHHVQISSQRRADRRKDRVPNDVDWIELIPSKYNTGGALSLEVRPGTQNVRYDLQSK
jgi:hypothetical protein